jgi:hypothetical protein
MSIGPHVTPNELWGTAPGFNGRAVHLGFQTAAALGDAVLSRKRIPRRGQQS